MGQEIIRVENASKSFRGHTVLKKVSLTCEVGNIYGIIGYNGRRISERNGLDTSKCDKYRKRNKRNPVSTDDCMDKSRSK